MRKLYFLLLLMIGVGLSSTAQVTVDVFPASTPYATGSVNSTGTKNDGNMTTINSTTNRGWALFDLSAIPAGSIVNSATITFTTYSTTLSTATNNIYGFRGDPSSLSGATLYTGLGAGSSLLAATWSGNTTTDQVNGPTALNAAGITFLSNNLGNNDVMLGFVRGSTNTYNIYGYPGTAAQKPKLTITYTTVSCASPNNITSSALTPTTATISWNASASTPSGGYQYEVRASGAAGSGATGLTASGSTGAGVLTTNVTGLTGNTTYSVYVRANCGGAGFSVWTSAYTFTTPCTSTNPPYSQDFESATVPGMPACTATENAGTGNNWVTVAAPGSGFTSKTLQYVYHSTNNANAWFYTQGLNLVSGTSYRLSYKYGNNSTTYVEKMEVKYGTSASAAGMTDLISTHASIVGGVPATGTYDFIPSATGVYYIGFHAISDFDQFNLYVDDISVVVTPTCEIPTGLTVTNITTTGADLNWTDPSSGNPPVNYQIYYNTTGTAPTGATTPTQSGIVGNTKTLSGLTPATTYSLWIRTNCGSGNTSAWTAVTTFTTACNSAAIPTAVQSFDAATMPVCWSRALITGTTNWAPAANNDGVAAPHTGANFMGKVYTASDALVISQPINMVSAGPNGARINVWIYRNTVNKANDRIRFHANITPDMSGATQLLEIFPLTTVAPTVSSAGWYNYTADIPSSFNTEPVLYIIGQGTTDGSFASYGIGFDDFKVEVIPSCEVATGVTVTNITTTGADVNWTDPTAGNTPVNYQVYYNTTGTAPTGATTPTVSGIVGNTTTLSGLTASTTYYLWIRTNCGTGNVSAWTPTAATFATLCTSAAIPTAVQSFDAATMPICWSRALVTGTINWAPAVSNDGVPSPHTGANFMGKVYTASDALVISQPINMTTAGTAGARVSVWIYRNAINKANDRIRFHVNLTPDLSGATQILEIFPLSTMAPVVSSNGWYKYTADIPASFNTEPTVYIVGQGTTDGTGASYGIGFDDFKVEVIPTCNEPTAVVASGLTVTNAQIDWTAPSGSTVTDYRWELRTSGAAGSGPTGLVSSGNTATTTANFTTLTGATTYTFYVRTNCVNPDVSTYASVSFTTLPPNDDCALATSLYLNTPVNGTTIGATQSIAGQLCAGFTGTADDDVWYKFTTHYAGNVTISMTNASANLDAVVIAYSGTCGAFTSIGCSDAIGNGANETVSLTGLTANTTYYFRVYSYGATAGDKGTFTVTITGSALPVTLIDFKGESVGSVNKLTWKTATETNNTGFEIQRSADGKNFSTLAFVATKAENGNSTSAINYNYNDAKPLGGANYYRLKQIDKDGKSAYSNIVVLKSKITEIAISSLYPNPATNEIKLVITSPSVEKVTLLVTDLTGKVLVQQSTQLVSGDNQQQLNVQSLAAGTYLVKAVCTNGCETTVHRFVKQ